MLKSKIGCNNQINKMLEDVMRWKLITFKHSIPLVLSEIINSGKKDAAKEMKAAHLIQWLIRSQNGLMTLISSQNL